jgi:hypothetical protein
MVWRWVMTVLPHQIIYLGQPKVYTCISYQRPTVTTIKKMWELSENRSAAQAEEADAINQQPVHITVYLMTAPQSQNGCHWDEPVLVSYVVSIRCVLWKRVLTVLKSGLLRKSSEVLSWRIFRPSHDFIQFLFHELSLFVFSSSPGTQ